MASLSDLGTLGDEDMLTTARTEVFALTARVQTLTSNLVALKVDNMSLKAENEHLSLSLSNANASLSYYVKCDVDGVDATSPPVASARSDDVDYFSPSSSSSPSQACKTTQDSYTYPTTIPIYSNTNHSLQINPLCVSLKPRTPSTLYLGSADSTLRRIKWGVFNSPSPFATKFKGTKVMKTFESPVVCVCVSYKEGLVACGLMDGTVFVLSDSESEAEADEGKDKDGERGFQDSCVKISKCHNKRVTAMSFNYDRSCREKNRNIRSTSSSSSTSTSTADRLMLATSSADGTVHIHAVSVIVSASLLVEEKEGSARQSLSCTLLRYMKTGTNPIEALTFTGANELCVYVREEHYLRYYTKLDIDTDTDTNTDTDHEENEASSPLLAFTKVTLNGEDRAYDDHVSFAVLSLKASPDDNLILCSTDKNLNLILPNDPAGKGRRVRELYGHTNDSYSNARCIWSCDGRYVVGNSQLDNGVYMWDCESGSVCKKLGCDGEGGEEHRGVVRDLVGDMESNTVVSCGFDKVVKVWV